MPRIEIITIGDELIEGRLVDTNACELSAKLADVGLGVAEHRTVGDAMDAMIEAFRTAAGRADAVLVSGGLGPTSDDLTAAAAATAFDRAVERSPEALEHTRRFFADRGRVMAPSNEKQADLPAGSTILPNPEGTAVGFRIDASGCRLYFLPGVPRELRRMADESVVPDLVRRVTATPPLVATLKLFGLGESDVAQRLDGLADGVPDAVRLTVQYRATFPEIHVRLVVEADDPAVGRTALDALVRDARDRLGSSVYAVGGARLDTDFPTHAAAVLTDRGLTVAAAEVASSGRLAQLLCSSSAGADCLAGSLAVPRTAAVADRLAVDVGDAEMIAEAIRLRFDASVGVAVLGSADGHGDTDPGALTVAAAAPGVAIRRDLHFPLDRERFQLLAAYAALRLMLRLLDGLAAQPESGGH
ncbi:MAG: molybdopterin-binding protein [Holophagae bacterium]|jgi:nicotinamide-nucleotide amidase